MTDGEFCNSFALGESPLLLEALRRGTDGAAAALGAGLHV
jgi:hypothetical protein